MIAGFFKAFKNVLANVSNGFEVCFVNSLLEILQLTLSFEVVILRRFGEYFILKVGEMREGKVESKGFFHLILGSNKNGVAINLNSNLNLLNFCRIAWFRI